MEAMSLSDYIIVMDKGKIMQFGTPEEIYNNPANFFTASFVGSPQINYYHCKVSDNTILIEQNLKIDNYFNIPEGEYIIAIRPEKMIINQEIDQSIKLKGKVIFYDNLGSHFILNILLSDKVTIRVIYGEKISRNQEVDIFIPLSSVFWFDKEGKRVR
ncbi:MAG: hypothetical protein ACK4GJ_05130, partial [bacterium]